MYLKWLSLIHIYCRSGNFRENFIFANSIKRHISDVKNSRLRQGLPISINDRVILPYREGFIVICKVSRKWSPHESYRINSTMYQLMKCRYLSHMGRDFLNTNVQLSCETRGLKC